MSEPGMIHWTTADQVEGIAFAYGLTAEKGTDTDGRDYLAVVHRGVEFRGNLAPAGEQVAS